MKEIIECFDKTISAIEAEIQNCNDFISGYSEFSNKHCRDQYYEMAVDKKYLLIGKLEKVLIQQKSLREQLMDE